ncbi:MAG TPA: HAD family hydrolase [Flavitalea sp.]|nr:HAD family hydrolase [Flavitalea sp.]
MRKPVKLAVFDIAGTTVLDLNAVGKAFVKAFELKKLAVPLEMVNPLMGYEKTLAIRMILKKIGVEIQDSLVTEIHEAFEEEMVNYYAYSPEVSAMPSAEKVMRLLKEKDIRIALNTGFSKLITDVIMERLLWSKSGLVDDYISSDEVENGRPDPSMINTLMARAGISDPEEVIKIGDTEVDINEGRNARCGMVIAVTTGAFSKEGLEPYHPDFIIDDLSDLPALIN